MNTLKRFIKDERGLETVEWVVMGCVIVLGVVAFVGILLDDIETGLTAIGSEITSAAQ
jgi:Flp pilus assembly pilin Flp